MSGLVSAGNGTTVALYTIADSGEPTGSALATTTTSGGGAFSLTVSGGATLSSRLAVVVGDGQNRTRAFVTATTNLTVSPISECVTRRVAAYGVSLDNYTLTELSTMMAGAVSQADIAGFDFSGYSTVSAAVDALMSNTAFATALNNNLVLAASSISQAAQCSNYAISQVSQAKSFVFKNTVSNTDFQTADALVDSALADSAQCPDANFLSAVLDILGEWDRVGVNVLTNPQPVFPFTLTYDFSADTLHRALAAVSGPALNALPRSAAKLDESSPVSAIQNEIETNTMPVLEAALAKLDSARNVASGDAGWAFTFPMDPQNPDLGNETVTMQDLDTLSGALHLGMGFVYYMLAFNLDAPDNWSTADPCPENGSTYYSGLNINICTGADANSDGTLTPGEILVPSPFGVLKNNGSTLMGSARIHINTGLALLETVVDAFLNDTSGSLTGQYISDSLLSDAEYYRHYLSEVRASFAGTATNITIPSEVECWRPRSPSGYSPLHVTDPDGNADILTSCASLITVREAISAPINFSALFSISDFRDILPSLVINQGTVHPAPDYAGNTAGGLFPGGIQSSWFDEKQYGFDYTFILKDNAGNLLLPPGQNITMSLNGSGPFTGNSVSTGTARFNRSSLPLSILPTADDYVTVNELFGVNAILQMSGYNHSGSTVFGSGEYEAVFSVNP
jgi:hypothetical protein